MKQSTLNKLSKESREAILKLEARIKEIELEKVKIDKMLKELDKNEAFIK